MDKPSWMDIRFTALTVAETDDGQSFFRYLAEKSINDLPANDVLIKVHYSSLNYKDSLSASGNRGVTRRYPHTPGVDAAGTVVHSSSPDWHPGDLVICTGFDLGMNTPGGFGQYIRVPAEWVLPLPEGLSLFETMQLGTAGFTAAQCVQRLIEGGVQPHNGPIAVTGATGGVGSVAVSLLHSLGYTVTAVTGKMVERPYLESIGATSVIDREEAVNNTGRMLLRERWAGVVDTVGGEILSWAVRSCRFDAVVTCCGNVASGDLALNVYPFILRGVRLQGIYSANCPLTRRRPLWQRLAKEWRIPQMNQITRCLSLEQLDDSITMMLAGRLTGRIVIDLQGTV